MGGNQEEEKVRPDKDEKQVVKLASLAVRIARPQGVAIAQELSEALSDTFPPAEVTVESYEVVSDTDNPELDQLGIAKHLDIKTSQRNPFGNLIDISVQSSRLRTLSLRIS